MKPTVKRILGGIMEYKLLAPDFESRGLKDYPKHYLETNYYETVHVIDGVATCSHPYSLELLLKKGYRLVESPKKGVRSRVRTQRG